jgi:hypothetical protein
MAEPEIDPELQTVFETALAADIDDNPVTLIERVYQMWWHWADFSIYVVSPTIVPIDPPLIILPETDPNNNAQEFVYNIFDHGFKLSTSKAQDMYTAGMSMYKLFNTIEKMIYILVERLKSGGIDQETEVQVAFGGHELAQRKAFESVINLAYNVVVTNFDPSEWGERYLKTIKRLADKGFGYPKSAPRYAPPTGPTLRRR